MPNPWCRLKWKGWNMVTLRSLQPTMPSLESKSKRSVMQFHHSCQDGLQTINFQVCCDSTITAISLLKGIIDVILTVASFKAGGAENGEIYNQAVKDLLGKLSTGG